MSKPNLSLNPVRSGADREPRDEAGAIAAAVRVFEDGLAGLRAGALIADDAASAAAAAWCPTPPAPLPPPPPSLRRPPTRAPCSRSGAVGRLLVVDK